MSAPGLRPVYGHLELRDALRASLRAGNLAQSLLLHGAPGVGKQRLALWLAQQVLCASPGADGHACGECQACRMALRMEHPDLHWFFPLPRPEASSPEKLRERLEEARGAELAARRADPFHVPAFDKAPSYFLGMVQNLQRLAATRPAMGSRQVFVVGDAEAMVPQESSPEAANAFLKLLEEPPPDTVLILTSSSPGALLPTIRSRVLPVRLLPLPADTVAEFLARERGLPAADAARYAAASAGAIGRALRLMPGAGGESALQKQRLAGRKMLDAALSSSEAERFVVAAGVAPAGARGEFTAHLAALAARLRDLMAAAAGAPDSMADPESAAELEAAATRHRIHPDAVAGSLLRVQRAQELAAGNVNPQLVLAELLRGVRADLLAGAAG